MASVREAVLKFRRWGGVEVMSEENGESNLLDWPLNFFGFESYSRYDCS